MYNPYQKYQNNSVMTASPEELTLMLYNGAIKFCNLGKEAIEKNNIEVSHKNIVKAQAIIQELRVTLDPKYPISAEMKRLYEFIEQLLLEANLKKDITKIDQALDLIRDFRDTWQEAMKVRKRA